MGIGTYVLSGIASMRDGAPRAIERFFDGCALVPPALVFMPAWHPNDPRAPFLAEPKRTTIRGAGGRTL